MTELHVARSVKFVVLARKHSVPAMLIGMDALFKVLASALVIMILMETIVLFSVQ